MSNNTVCFKFFCLCVCLSRNCLASSRPLQWSLNLTSLRMTGHSHLLNSGRKVWTSQRITQAVVMKREPIMVQRERVMSMENSHCLRDTKIPANSLVGTPDPTTKMSGMKSLFFCCKLQYTSLCYYSFVFWLKVITTAFGVVDISLDITISTTTV